MKQTKNAAEIHRRCIKSISIFESGFLALANVQMHLKRHIKIFSESKDWLSKFKSKTQEPKKLYDKCGQWKYSGRRSSDKTTEVEMDPYEKTS